MKEKFQKLLSKYKISRDSYYTQSPYNNMSGCQVDRLEISLTETWYCRIAQGWYGFSLGKPCPDNFYGFINAFLKLIEKYNKDFEIYQIKIKLGGVRMYLGNISKETQELVNIAEHHLHDKYLIY